MSPHEAAPSGRRLALTKLRPPPLPATLVSRPALYDLIDEGADRPVTVLVGLPGSGKTATLAGWATERLGGAALWISCDARDRDPVTFWTAVVTALRTRWPDGLTEAADALASFTPDPVEVAIGAVNDLVAIEEPVTVIVDDFHLAAPAGPSVAYFIEHAPATVRLVLGGRSDPAIDLPRLRLRGQVHDIRQDRLEFEAAETRAFLRAHGVEIDARDAAALTESTGGWVAALQLTALSVRAGTDIKDLLGAVTRSRALTDYLVTEVLDRQRPAVRDFLTDTSILDELDADICDALRDSSDSGRMLRRITEANLFLVPLGPTGAYRYHDLFRALVHAQLRADDPQRERALHRRAAEAFERDGRVELAFHHLLEAGEPERAFGLLGDTVLTVYFAADTRALHRMLAEAEAHIPHVSVTAMLPIALALALGGRLDEADFWIDCICNARDVDQIPSARIALVRSLVLAYRGAARDAENLADDAERGLDPDDQLVAGVPAVRIRSRLWLDDPQGARAEYERFRGRTFFDPAVVPVLLRGGLAWVACVEGSLRESAALSDAALEASERLGLGEHPSIVEPLRTRARLAYEHGELEVAERLTERALRISRVSRPSYVVLDLLVLARVCLATGRTVDAHRAVDDARTVLKSVGGPLAALCAAAEARVLLALGDAARAVAITENLADGVRRDVLCARLDLDRGAPRDALARLERCVTTTHRQALDVALLRSRCETMLDRPADGALASVIALARDEHFVQPLVEELGDTPEPLARMLRAGSRGTWEQAVLDALDRARPHAGAPGAVSGTVVQLSVREHEVVRYLASRLTNAEIAAELHISLNTVRTHVAAVYRKLGVSSRREAVETARAFGLLPR